jgi:thiamine-phosphate pyrophosphorylase
MLVVEAGADAPRHLGAALEAGPIASVCLLPGSGSTYEPGTLRALIAIIQKAGAAALLVDDARLARTLKADGVHLSAHQAKTGYAEARSIVGSGCIVGADAGRSRDLAMRLGEDGADYIAFSAPDFVADQQAARERRLDLIRWWAEIFEVPCVAFDVDGMADATTLAAAGADFVALRLGPSLAPADVHKTTVAMLAALSPHDA